MYNFDINSNYCAGTESKRSRVYNGCAATRALNCAGTRAASKFSCRPSILIIEIFYGPKESPKLLRPNPKKARLPLGERIKARRTELGMTLQELARRSSLSAPFISQAERDLTIPSLVSLLALAKALDVDLVYFMRLPEVAKIVHRASKPSRIEIDSPVIYHDLASQLPNRQFDVILMHIPPGHAFPVDQRNGEDVLYLVSGELHASAGETKTVLKAGDSMHFDSRLPHTAHNASDQEAVLLYVGTPSVFSTPHTKLKGGKKSGKKRG